MTVSFFIECDEVDYIFNDEKKQLKSGFPGP